MSLDASLGACLHPVFTAALLSNQCPSHRKLQSTHSHRHARVVTLKNIMVRRRSGLGNTMYTFDTKQRQQRGIHVRPGGEPALHFQPTLRLFRGSHGNGSRVVSNSFCVMARGPDDELLNDEEQADENDLRSTQTNSSSGNPGDMGKQLAKIVREMGGSSSDPKNKLLVQFANVLNKAYDIGAASAARAVIAMAGKSVDDVLQAKPSVADEGTEELPNAPNPVENGGADSLETDSAEVTDSKLDLPLNMDTPAASETVVTSSEVGPNTFGPTPDPWEVPQGSSSEDLSQDFSADSSMDAGEDPKDLIDSENSPILEAQEETNEKPDEGQAEKDAATEEGPKEDGATEQVAQESVPVSAPIPTVVEAQITQDPDEVSEESDKDGEGASVLEDENDLEDEKLSVPEAESQTEETYLPNGEEQNCENQFETEPVADKITGIKDEYVPDLNQDIDTPAASGKAEALTSEDELPVIQDPILSDLHDSTEPFVDDAESISESSELDVLEVRTRNFQPDFGVQAEDSDSELDNSEDELRESEILPKMLDVDTELGEPEDSIPVEETEHQDEQSGDTEDPEDDTSEDSRKLAVGLSSIRRRAKIEQPVSIKRPSKRSPSVEESLKTQHSIGGLDGLKYVKEYAETAKGKMQKPPNESPPNTSDFYTPPPALLGKDNRSTQPQSPPEQVVHTRNMQKIGTMWWQSSTDDGGNGPNGRGGGGSGSGGNGNEENVPEEGGWWLQVFVSVLTMTAAVFSVLKAVVKPKDRRTSTY